MLTVHEQCVLQKVAGANVSSEIKNILKEVDRNGDGRIDYEEFCDMMRKVISLRPRVLLFSPSQLPRHAGWLFDASKQTL